MSIIMVKMKGQSELNENFDLDDLIDQIGKILAEEYISLMKDDEEENRDD